MRRAFLRRLPTALTVMRLVLCAPIAALLIVDAPWADHLALALFIAAAASDYFDGVLARAFGPSVLGARLDPLADKALVASVLVPSMAAGGLEWGPLLAAVAILLRELTIALVRRRAEQQGKPLPVLAGAKWKTALQFFACALLIAAPLGGPAGGLAAEFALYAAAASTLLTGYAYLRRVRSGVR